MRRAVAGADAVLHAATLHKPHVGSHRRQEFVDTNVTGTLTLLEEAVAAGVGRFVFTSTTSAFGRALTPPPGAPAGWIDEDVAPVPRNVYGVTKTAAEDLCELVHRDHGLPCLILRTSRFFPEADDRDDVRAAYDDLNLKVNELLYRRADLEDIVGAHRCALERAPAIGFGRYIVTATTPFTRADLAELRADAPAVLRRRCPGYEAVYERARLADVRRHRPRLRQRAGARGARLAPALRLRPRARAARGGRGPAQRARARRRRQGLPPGLDRALHRALTRRNAASGSGPELRRSADRLPARAASSMPQFGTRRSAGARAAPRTALAGRVSGRAPSPCRSAVRRPVHDDREAALAAQVLVLAGAGDDPEAARAVLVRL